MSMFKTIGLITGGVVIGVMSTSVLSSHGYTMSNGINNIFKKSKSNNFTDEEINEDSFTNSDSNRTVEINEDGKKILRKTMQAEGIISEIKEIIYTDTLHEILPRVKDMEEIILDIKNVLEVNDYEGNDYKFNGYETEEEMIDRVVEEVIEEERNRANSIADEIIEKYKDKDNHTEDNYVE